MYANTVVSILQSQHIWKPCASEQVINCFFIRIQIREATQVITLTIIDTLVSLLYIYIACPLCFLVKNGENVSCNQSFCCFHQCSSIVGANRFKCYMTPFQDLLTWKRIINVWIIITYDVCFIFVKPRCTR